MAENKKNSQKNEDPILYSPKISYAFPQNMSAPPRDAGGQLPAADAVACHLGEVEFLGS